MILVYDFEVFKYDWMMGYAVLDERKEGCICNDPEALKAFYKARINDIWVGFNSRNYDQYILKSILEGLDPKRCNDFIILYGQPGWKFCSRFRNYPLNNYDVMNNIDRGLKFFEGSMGNNIKETSVPFDLDRKLTPEELEETKKYNLHDVEQTAEVFLKRKADFEAQLDLVKIICKGRPLDLSLISKTRPQLSAIILDATKQEHDDEFDINFPDTMQIQKYKAVPDWYADPENHHYKDGNKKHALEIMIAGCPHTFAWGGVHGALEKYHGEGFYLMADVASLYPSLMIRYNLHSRNMKDPQKFVDIYNTRLKLKKEHNPLQKVLKLVLNSTYGVMKDYSNALCDPRQANRVCVYGQLLILDLIEHIERAVPGIQLIQSNTDGILVKLQDPADYYKVDDVAYEWEQRTGLNLEFDEYHKVFQKDVNNYVIVAWDGHTKTKGAYVKALSDLDYDLPILNTALVKYMVDGVPVSATINGCNDLKEFQMVGRASGKYTCILYGEKALNEKTIRIFASNDEADPGVVKIHAETGRPAKISNSPEHCFIWNDDVNGVPVPEKLNKQWYVDLAEKRLKDFGVN